MIHDSIIRERLVTGDKTAADVTRDISRPILNQPSTAWKIGFTLSLIFLGIFGVSCSGPCGRELVYGISINQ